MCLFSNRSQKMPKCGIDEHLKSRIKCCRRHTFDICFVINYRKDRHKAKRYLFIAEPAGKARQRSSIAKEIWGAFHSTKNSGSKFRKFHVANGTVNREISRMVIPAWVENNAYSDYSDYSSGTSCSKSG